MVMLQEVINEETSSGRIRSQKVVGRFLKIAFCSLLMAFPLKMYSKFG